MPPEDENEELGENGEPKPKESPGKKMREQLETALAANKDLSTRLALHEAGLGALSDRQKKAIVREAVEEGKEITGDYLKEIAKDLGFKAPAAPKEGAETTDPPNNNSNGQNQHEGEDGDNPPDPSVDEDMSYMEAIDRVARRGNSADPDSFEAKITAATTQEEVKALIRQRGQRVGILLEEDVD